MLDGAQEECLEEQKRKLAELLSRGGLDSSNVHAQTNVVLAQMHVKISRIKEEIETAKAQVGPPERCACACAARACTRAHVHAHMCTHTCTRAHVHTCICIHTCR